MDLQLKGKVAIVGGASKGLGRACAQALAEEGANLAICSRSQADLEKAAQEIRDSTGVEVLAFAGDLDRTTPSAISSPRRWSASAASTCSSATPAVRRSLTRRRRPKSSGRPPCSAHCSSSPHGARGDAASQEERRRAHHQHPREHRLSADPESRALRRDAHGCRRVREESRRRSRPRRHTREQRLPRLDPLGAHAVERDGPREGSSASRWRRRWKSARPRPRSAASASRRSSRISSRSSRPAASSYITGTTMRVDGGLVRSVM